VSSVYSVYAYIATGTCPSAVANLSHTSISAFRIPYYIVSKIVLMRATLERWATGRNILILLGLYIAMVALVLTPAEKFLKAHSTGDPPIDLQMFFGPDHVYSEFRSMDHEGLHYYRRVEQTADVIYPAIYTLLFGLLWLFLLRRAVPQRSFLQSLWYIPFIAIIFDYLENLCIIMIINKAPATSQGLATALSAFNAAKWLFFFVTLALLGTGLLFWLRQGMQKRGATTAE
jgi:hypothetical protein